MWSMTFEFSKASDLIRLTIERSIFSSAIRNSGTPIAARQSTTRIVLRLDIVIVSLRMLRRVGATRRLLPRYNFGWREDYYLQRELSQSDRRGRKRRRTGDRGHFGEVAERFRAGRDDGHQAAEARRVDSGQ